MVEEAFVVGEAVISLASFLGVIRLLKPSLVKADAGFPLCQEFVPKTPE